MSLIAATGVLVGGWEYVIAAYVATWVFLLGYQCSLWWRKRQEDSAHD